MASSPSRRCTPQITLSLYGVLRACLMEIMNESRNGCEISIFTDITPTALGEGRCFFLNDAGALGVGSSLEGQATFPKGGGSRPKRNATYVPVQRGTAYEHTSCRQVISVYRFAASALRSKKLSHTGSKKPHSRKSRKKMVFSYLECVTLHTAPLHCFAVCLCEFLFYAMASTIPI